MVRETDGDALPREARQRRARGEGRLRHRAHVHARRHSSRRRTRIPGRAARRHRLLQLQSCQPRHPDERLLRRRDRRRERDESERREHAHEPRRGLLRHRAADDELDLPQRRGAERRGREVTPDEPLCAPDIRSSVRQGRRHVRHLAPHVPARGRHGGRLHRAVEIRSSSRRRHRRAVLALGLHRHRLLRLQPPHGVEAVGHPREYDPSQKTTRRSAARWRRASISRSSSASASTSTTSTVNASTASRNTSSASSARSASTASSSGSVRAEKAVIAHLSYGFVFSEQFRLEAFYDHGLIDRQASPAIAASRSRASASPDRPSARGARCCASTSARRSAATRRTASWRTSCF
jgi:hypothetical protein